MKKFKSKIILSTLLCIVLLASTVLVATAATDYGKRGKVKIHFLTDDWSSPRIYYWNTLPTNIEVDWPGDKMTKEKDGKTSGTWYVYEFSEEYSKINFIINDGGKQGENQTEEFTKTAGEWWYKDNKWYSYDPDQQHIETSGDFRDETIYFLMTTRFYDGDESNNTQCIDGQDQNDSYDPPWRGDFKGLIEKLDYIKAMGFSAIWITPVVKNLSGYDYHGYHAVNFSEVDSRYESQGATYQDLINACHEKDIKVIQDIVLNHTSNNGEENLKPLVEQTGDPSEFESIKRMSNSMLPENYDSLDSGKKHDLRYWAMKKEGDATENFYHHQDGTNFEGFTVTTGQFDDNCVDLNTENAIVSDYLIDAYTKYINMGVDAFRIDTVKHISRLTFNNEFLPAFKEAGGEDFYMFGECAARVHEVWNKGVPPVSSQYYTWNPESEKDYFWSKNPEDWAENLASTEKEFNDNMSESKQPTSDNAFLKGNEYHKPDYTYSSGMGMIDFTMHWNFDCARNAFNIALQEDQYYNDSTWNVTYVDSHDYGPNSGVRYTGGTAAWAENLDLMFTFRGIPCIYYGSEIEFQAGKDIDKGATKALEDTGRAYFGDHLKGDVTVTDFAEYTNATGTMAETLNSILSLHIQKLNKIRREIPALRKGQYSTEGISGGSIAYKRRYTGEDNGSNVDSFVCVSISGGANFTGIPNGTYVDAVTGDSKTVTNGSLSVSCSGQGNMRVYVLQNSSTTTGKIGGSTTYLK